MPQNKTLPPLPPGFQWDATPTTKSTPTAAAPSAPKRTGNEDLSPEQVGVRQLDRVGQGVIDFGASLSPVRFRDGWTSPNLEVPELVRGVAGAAFHGAMGDYPALLKDVQAPFQSAGTAAAGLGALFMPNTFQAPSQGEWDEAGRSAGQNAAGVIAAKAMPEAPRAPQAVRQAATKAGIPQKMAAAAEPTPGATILNNPVGVITKGVTGPILRRTAQMLYEPELPKPTPMIHNAEFVETPQPPAPEFIDAEYVHRPAPPQAPPQLMGRTGQPLQLPASTGPAQLQSGGVYGIPGGTDGMPIPADPRLPHAYSSIPVNGPTAPPAIMGRGGRMIGQEGGIPPRGEQTVTAVDVPETQTPGYAVAERTNSGRTARAIPKKKSTPKPAPEPPPKKKAAKKGS